MKVDQHEEVDYDLNKHRIEVHTSSKLPVKRKHSICGTVRCMSTPQKRKRGHERDRTQMAESGSIPTKERHKGVEPIFSATPPLEALRVLLCVACQEDVFRVEDSLLISIGDVSRAHFYADPVRDVNVRLPNEDPKAKEPGVCGKLRKTM